MLHSQNAMKHFEGKALSLKIVQYIFKNTNQLFKITFVCFKTHAQQLYETFILYAGLGKKIQRFKSLRNLRI